MNAPEDNLPPVQPPSPGFLMQLFVVPLVIVAAIVGVCLMFNWLAHMGSRPQDLVDDLAKLNAGSWQKALTIANVLTDRQHAELRQDETMAKQLAEVLDAQLDAGSPDPDRVKLRVYLCSALGVFEIPDGMPTLIRAARQQQDLADVEVRKTAIEAIARRADVSPELRDRMRADRELTETLRQASSEHAAQMPESDLMAQLRVRAAYALGVLGGAEALDLLASMLADPEPAVRYNAATGLARHGDQRAVDRLVQMLEPVEVDADDVQGIAEFTAANVIKNALRASGQLANANPSANLQPVRDAVQALIDDPNLSDGVRRGIEAEAKQTLVKLDAGRP
jgi:HEAT repeat protein